MLLIGTVLCRAESKGVITCKVQQPEASAGFGAAASRQPGWPTAPRLARRGREEAHARTCSTPAATVTMVSALWNAPAAGRAVCWPAFRPCMTGVPSTKHTMSSGSMLAAVAAADATGSFMDCIRVYSQHQLAQFSLFWADESWARREPKWQDSRECFVLVYRL